MSILEILETILQFNCDMKDRHSFCFNISTFTGKEKLFIYYL